MIDFTIYVPFSQSLKSSSFSSKSDTSTLTSLSDGPAAFLLFGLSPEIGVLPEQDSISCHIHVFACTVKAGVFHRIQLDLANSNSVILNFLLFGMQNHFPWICPSVIYYWLFQTPTISHIFCLSCEFTITGFNCILKLYIFL